MANVQVSVRPGPERQMGGRLSSQAKRALATTPGRLRLWSLAIIAAMATLAVGGLATHAHRTNGVRAVDSAEPLLVDAQQINTSLSAADASAANAFLSGGAAPAALRQQYTGALADAASHLNSASREVGTTASATDTLLLAQQVPVYAGLVETARANNRQGFPVGAAYLRQANQLMSKTVLPATQRLYRSAGARMGTGGRTANSLVDTVVMWLALAVALGTLVWAQVWIRRRTNRLVNVPLLAATVLTLVVAAVVLVALHGEASDVGLAQRQGSAVVDLVAQARNAAFTAKGDESLTLIGRGNGTAFENDFSAQQASLEGLLAAARRQAATVDAQQATTQAVDAESAYVKVHKQIRALDDGGRFDAAVALAVGSGPGSANAAFEAMDAPLRTALASSQTEFEQQMRRGRDQLRNLSLVVPLGLLLAAGLALLGIERRINEYR